MQAVFCTLSSDFNASSPREQQPGLILAVMAFNDTLQWKIGVKEPGYGETLTFRLLGSLYCQCVFGVLQSWTETNNISY